jgi:hypothetical protein
MVEWEEGEVTRVGREGPAAQRTGDEELSSWCGVPQTSEVPNHKARLLVSVPRNKSNSSSVQDKYDMFKDNRLIFIQQQQQLAQCGNSVRTRNFQDNKSTLTISPYRSPYPGMVYICPLELL